MGRKIKIGIAVKIEYVHFMKEVFENRADQRPVFSEGAGEYQSSFMLT